MISIGLCNPKSPTNVGAVMRAAGCYCADAVYYSGERYERAVKFQTDTKNSQSKIPLMHVDDLLAVPMIGKEVVCVELVIGAIPLPEFEHPENAHYIFGPEDASIPQDIIDQANHIVYVPTVGCMNLAASVNVLLYDRLSKSPSMNAGDELIKQSRDVNNRLFRKA